jgi:CubicO group peptidase (beta-lactamase class C family)
MIRKLALAAGLLLAVPALAQTAPSAADMERLRSHGAQVLFWNQAQRDAGFPAMEKTFPTKSVEAGGKVRKLPAGKPLAVPESDIEAFMAAQNVAGLIVLQDGKIRLERYARGFGPDGRWTSFSVAKSFTSTLVGAAIKDGKIKSLDDPVTTYIPELAGSGYDGVTVAQLLAMTSGVKWNEDYTDPKSDVAQMLLQPIAPGEDATIAYMRKLPSEAAPGAKWVYKTGETNLVGVLVRRATGKGLAEYLSEKIWKPYGMEQPALWMIDPSGYEIGGCCLSISLRDYARMGQLTLEGGKATLAPTWFARATAKHAEIGVPGFGYGYQWWTYPEGRYGAQGIFGQSIRVDPKRRMVIVAVSAWPRATDQAMGKARYDFFEKLFALGD